MSWETTKLGDVLTIQNGYAFDSKSFSNSDGTPLIRIRDLKNGVETKTNYNGMYDDKFLVNAGDLLIGMDGEFGCFEWKGKPSLLNQRVCRLMDFSNQLLPRFLFYGINQYLKEIESKTVFITVKHISSKQIKDIPFPIPPLPVQKQIVEKLDAAFADIDKAISATEKNIENAEALFQKAINESQGELVALDELVTIKTGKLNSNAAVENGQYPFFTCSRKIFSINEFAFDCEALLLAGNNASGDFNVKHYQGKFNAYQRTYVITINDSKKVLYKHLYFQLLNSLASFKKMSVGANTKFLKLGMIKTLKVPLPTLAEQQNHLSHIEIIQENKEKLKDIYLSKLRLLEALKSSILNQAFSGELTKDAA